MLLRRDALAWLVGGRLRPFRVGQKRLSTFGSLPVRGGGSPVQCGLPLVLARVLCLSILGDAHHGDIAVIHGTGAPLASLEAPVTAVVRVPRVPGPTPLGTGPC
jgi:hypothetical protein